MFRWTSAPTCRPRTPDPALLQRALVNLIANAPPARAHRNRAGRVDQRVRRSRAAAGHRSGPGIPPERREDVFVPFQRLGDTDNTTGVGLGLALSKGFVEAMGGTLEPEDTPGGGLTMVIELPAATVVRTPHRRRRPADGARPADHAERQGYDVVTATDGKEHWTSPIREHPDIVVIDLGMPGLTGVEVIQAHPRLERAAHPRRLRPQRVLGQGRGAGCRRRRLRHQAVLSR